MTALLHLARPGDRESQVDLQKKEPLPTKALKATAPRSHHLQARQLPFTILPTTTGFKQRPDLRSTRLLTNLLASYKRV
jgi:hypothetical protein